MSRTIRIALPAVFIAMVAGVFFLRRPAPPSPTAPVEAPSSAPITKAPEAKKPLVPTSQLMAQPVHQIHTPSDDRRECAQSWNPVAGEDLEALLRRISSGELKTSPACLEIEKKRFKTNAGAFDPKACLQTLNKLREAKEKKAGANWSDNCLVQAMLYRAQIIDALTEDIADPKRLEPSALINKMWVRAFSGKLGAEDKEGNLALADALIEKEPQLYGAHKFKVLVEALDVAQTKDGGVEAKVDALQKAVASCEEFGVKDLELVEAQMIGQAALGQDHLRDYVQSALQRDPQSPTLNYFSASVSWKAGDRATAERIVAGLAAKFPQDTRYRDTLKGIRTGKPGDKVFSTNLSFNFDRI